MTDWKTKNPKTVSEWLNDPARPESWNREKCPEKGPCCILVSDGKGAWACRTCGAAYHLDQKGFRSFDWHGPWPWSD